MPDLSRDDALLDLNDVKAITRLSHASIYQKIAGKSFPRPAKIGKLSRWSRAEVNAWIQQRLEERAA